MPFACSMKFRTNAQKKRIDVWLIYRCSACDETWNLPIHERVAINHIPRDEFQAIACNHPDLALRHAFDRGRLARHGMVVEDPTAIAVRKSQRNACDGDPSAVEIALMLTSPSSIRLDRLLATELGITRSQLQVLRARGALSPTHKALRSPIVDGQVVSIDLSVGLVSASMAATIRRGASGCSDAD